MRSVKTLVLLIILTICGCADLSAQLVVTDKRTSREITDSLRREFDHGPYFSLYKDNYFICGTALNHVPDGDHSDVKFQISISQKLTKSVLPWNTYLYLVYTQRMFWNVFHDSMPMREFVFNPGIGLTKPLFSRDRYIGKVSLLLEHESNGRDETDSRSWNRVSLIGAIAIDDNLMVHGKAWIPIIDSQWNRDILKYAGIWQNGLTFVTNDKKWSFDLTMVKRLGFNLNFNTILGISWCPWKSTNQYLYLQWYQGRGEGLYYYKQYTNMLRVGICIKPRYFSDF